MTSNSETNLAQDLATTTTAAEVAVANTSNMNQIDTTVKVTFDALNKQQQQVAVQHSTAAASGTVPIPKVPTIVGPPPSSIDHRNMKKENTLTTKEAFFINGRNQQDKRVNYETYHKYKETLPSRFHPLIQFLDDTELKYYNDNLFTNTPFGFPTKALLLKDKLYKLPILKDSLADKARFKRKCEEKQKSIVMSRKKFDFRTCEGESAHYFLTGGRFNRNDTIDSKLLNKYGIFINKHDPSLVYFKSKSYNDLPTNRQSKVMSYLNAKKSAHASSFNYITSAKESM